MQPKFTQKISGVEGSCELVLLYLQTLQVRVEKTIFIYVNKDETLSLNSICIWQTIKYRSTMVNKNDDTWW